MKFSLKAKRAIWAYVFIALPFCLFLSIRIFPILYAFSMSFHEWDLLARERPFIFLDNFKHLYADSDVFRIAVVNTAQYVLVSVPLGLAISLGVALLLNTITKGLSFLRMLFFIPYMTLIVAISWVWRWMFMCQGILNHIIAALGFSRQPFLRCTSQAIYVVISNIVWQSIGFFTIIFLAGLKQIPRTFYEASSIDGASPWAQFTKITIPLLNPTIVFLSVIATIQTLRAFTQIFNITGAGRWGLGTPLNTTMSLVKYIYQLAFVNFDMGLASAVTVFLFACILTVTVIQLKVLTKKVDY